MLMNSIKHSNARRGAGSFLGNLFWGTGGSGFGWMVFVCLLTTWGCSSVPVTKMTDEDRKPYERVGVQPGDVVKIAFPGAPTMNGQQQVQSDGTMTMLMGGSLQVRGKTPPEIEKAILEAYGPQLVVKEVSVSVESAGFPIFVSGAVLRPGRVLCRQSLTVLEAIVDAGGFNEGRADLKKVRVVRKQDDGTTKTFVLDLRASLEGRAGEPFYLRPSDVVYVPERFALY